MKLTWLGQAGIWMEWNGQKILIDPYFSDSCHKLNPASFRRTSVREELFALEPDVLITTHNHLDHYDPESLAHFFRPGRELVFLGPNSCWQRARVDYKGMCNPVLFNRHTTWTEKGLSFRAVKAEHSDPDAIGVIISDGKTTVYVTGDTLFNSEIFPDLPENIDLMLLPVNGVGNNLNPVDAARFADKVGAKISVPVHIGMFDEMKPTVFRHPSAKYLAPYESIEL